ncbi:MAG: hypothetical protein H0T82_09520 [Sphingomonas sp.]|jgi:hypothetical protein|nr:hypothetical protein [Sphingomonas sp.]
MRKILPAAFAACAFIATPVSAQQAGLVNVEIGDVSILNDFLNDTQIAALNNLNVPITVQVPIGVAANVCDVSANVLAQQAKNGGATCTAESGSQALAQSVNRQMLKQKK